MRTTRTLTAALFVALASPVSVVAFEHTAMAQAPADDASTKAARARFQAGVEFYDKGEYEKARVEFSQAYALKNHPAVLLNYAQSSLKSGHHLEASKLFQKYLKDPAAPADKRGEAEAGLSEARSKLARLDIQVANGSEINVDGEKIGFAPLDAPIDLEPGPHVVKTKGPEGMNEQRVTLTAGQVLQVRGNGPATTAPVTTPPTTTPPTTTAPATTTPATTGGTDAAATSTVTPPATSSDSGAASHSTLLSPPKPLWPVFAIGGVGVVGLIIAPIMGAQSSSANDKLTATTNQIKAAAVAYHVTTTGTCTQIAKFPTSVQGQVAANCNSAQTSQNNANTDATIGNVALVVGIVGIVGAGAYYLFGPKGDTSAAKTATHKPSRPLVAPWIGSNQGGATVIGTF